VTPAQSRALDRIQAELARLSRYDESVVHETWIRQRYELGAATYASARTAAVRTAWHEAGHAVAAWRHCEQALIPQRLRIRQVARALLVHPRHLPYPVAAAVAASV
jgi:hypothetical protein